MSEKLHILIVEDDLDHALLAEMAIKKKFENCQIDLARNSDEALKALDEIDYSLVITDYKLADIITGIGILRAERNKGKNMPFIIITSQGNERIAVEAMKEGAWDYVIKDLSFQETLPAAIKRTLESYDVERAKARLEEDLRKETIALEKANEKLKKSDRLKSDFIANMSHEFRTPLTAITALASLAGRKLGGQVSDIQNENLETIERNAKRLDWLIDNLLDITRIEAGMFTFKPEIVDLSGLVEDAVASLKPEYRKKGVSLTHSVAQNSPDVYVDPNRITQVLCNLIGNAIKFTPKGKNIKVQVSPLSSSRDLVDVLVVDQGIGISSEDQAKIFDRLYQTEKRSNTGTKGVGLGLAISKEIVEIHGGNIWVKSELGQGSQFGFSVPVYKPLEALHLNIRNAINKAREKNSSVFLAAMRVIYLDGAKTLEQQEKYYKEVVKRVTHQVRTSDIVLPFQPQTGILVVLVFVDDQGLESVEDRMKEALSKTNYSTHREIYKLKAKFISCLEKYEEEKQLFDEVGQAILDLEGSFEYESEKNLSC